VEDLLRDTEDVKGSTALCLQISGTRVSTAFTDASLDSRIGVIEFEDDEGLSNLGSLCVQIGVKEIISTGTIEKSLENLMNRCGIVSTIIPKQAFQTHNLDQDLDRLCIQGSLRVEEARGCVAALIGYLDLTSDAGNHGNYVVYKYGMKEYLKLDSTAITALNLFPAIGGRKNSSLFGVLNVCTCAFNVARNARRVKDHDCFLNG
jgi:DNA mismatch repair protein MSH2